MGEHVINNIDTSITINLLADALENRRALPSERNRHLECFSFSSRHGEHVLSNRLQKLDALNVSFNVEVIVVALFLDTVQAFLKLVLSMSNESAILRRPRRV